jgi:hypothetical protein
MVMIRRELPLTNFASPAGPVAYFRRGFSFVLAPAAADPVLELDYAVHRCFCFSLFGKVLFLLFVFHHAASCCVQADSALIPMAQMNPVSSRPIAVMVFLWSLPAAISFM